MKCDMGEEESRLEAIRDKEGYCVSFVLKAEEQKHNYLGTKE